MPKSATVAEWLLEAARWAASADNTQPWRFRVLQDAIEIWFSPAAHSFALKHPASLMSFGMLQENCRQMAAALRIELTIEYPDSFGPTCPVCIIHTKGSELSHVVSIDPPALFARHTNRLPYAKKMLNEAIRQQVMQCTESSSHIQLLTSAALCAPWIPLIRRGSELRFQTREAHEWLDASLRMTELEAARGDGLDVSTFHLPPGGRALLGYIRDWERMARLNRIGFYKVLAMIEADLVKQAPALLILSGRAGESGAMAAGTTLARSWILLNQLGLAVQPYFVVPDQLLRLDDDQVSPTLRPQVSELADAARALLPVDDVLYMMLRVGYPKKTAVKSRRLTIEQLQYR